MWRSNQSPKRTWSSQMAAEPSNKPYGRWLGHLTGLMAGPARSGRPCLSLEGLYEGGEQVALPPSPTAYSSPSASSALGAKASRAAFAASAVMAQDVFLASAGRAKLARRNPRRRLGSIPSSAASSLGVIAFGSDMVTSFGSFDCIAPLYRTWCPLSRGLEQIFSRVREASNKPNGQGPPSNKPYGPGPDGPGAPLRAPRPRVRVRSIERSGGAG